MMKQILRVKQIADQKFQRSEKAGVLSDELNAAEKRVDLLKESCYATGKKLSACMQRLTPDTSERRNSVKKIPEAALAQCMEEWGLSLGENSILGLTLVDYAQIQETLANDLLSYKLQVEENVVQPLQNILNIDIEKILKFRKQLFKLNSEMETAKQRYHNAQRSSQQASGNSAAAAKAQLLKEEAEDLVSRVDQSRDSLTAEMFHLISREPEMSQLFVKLCQLQLEYHRKAFYMLESAMPELESQIRACPYQPVFGVSLEEHLQVSKRDVAIVLETCVCWLLESAMEEEGLFRIGGSMIKIKKMKSAFDAGFHHLIEEERDPHNVAGVLKLYLRSLPEPLLTFQLYDHWMEAAMEPDHDSRLRSLWSVVNSLPETHLRNLRYLIKFLAKLCQNSDVNKMSIQNVAIVIGPNLLWPPVDDCVLGMNMTATNLHSSIVDTLITYSEWFFPGECEFYVSTPTSPRHMNDFSSMYGSQVSLSTTKLSNGDSAVESMSSSPTNSSPKSPSPRVPVRPRKKAAPKAPQNDVNLRSQITRSVSYGGFNGHVLARAHEMAASSARVTSLSMSHENLLSAGRDITASFPSLRAENQLQGHVAHNNKSQEPEPQAPRPSRPKPPRTKKNGLPPLVERTRRNIERPSVPPPERPDSFCKSGSMSSDLSCDADRILDPEDISISFDSSGSESYNECQMSLPEDSDGEVQSCPAPDQKSPAMEDECHEVLEAVREISEDINTEIDPDRDVEFRRLHDVYTHTVSSVTMEKIDKLIDLSQEVESSRRPQDVYTHTVSSVNMGKIDKVIDLSQEVMSNRRIQDVYTHNSNHLTIGRIDGVNFSEEIESKRHPQDVFTHNSNDATMERIDEVDPIEEVEFRRRPQDVFDRNGDGDRPISNGSLSDDAFDCHFTGGTPTWFDHYGDDKRQSNTLWFANNAIDSDRHSTECVPQKGCDGKGNCGEGDHFRTIIEVGNGSSRQTVKSSSYASGMAIKLRVNSETQDTRL